MDTDLKYITLRREHPGATSSSSLQLLPDGTLKVVGVLEHGVTLRVEPEDIPLLKAQLDRSLMLMSECQAYIKEPDDVDFRPNRLKIKAAVAVRRATGYGLAKAKALVESFV